MVRNAYVEASFGNQGVRNDLQPNCTAPCGYSGGLYSIVRTTIKGEGSTLCMSSLPSFSAEKRFDGVSLRWARGKQFPGAGQCGFDLGLLSVCSNSACESLLDLPAAGYGNVKALMAPRYRTVNGLAFGKTIRCPRRL